MGRHKQGQDGGDVGVAEEYVVGQEGQAEEKLKSRKTFSSEKFGNLLAMTFDSPRTENSFYLLWSFSRVTLSHGGDRKDNFFVGLYLASIDGLIVA